MQPCRTSGRGRRLQPCSGPLSGAAGFASPPPPPVCVCVRAGLAQATCLLSLHTMGSLFIFLFCWFCSCTTDSRAPGEGGGWTGGRVSSYQLCNVDQPAQTTTTREHLTHTYTHTCRCSLDGSEMHPPIVDTIHKI